MIEDLPVHRTHFDTRSKDWWLSHFFLPLGLGLLLLSLLTWLETDLWLSGWLFKLEGGVSSWPLRYWWLTENVLHTGGRDMVVLASAVLIGLLIASLVHPRFKPYRRGFLYLLASVATSVVLVRVGKSITQVNCPWDLQIFGGQFPYAPFPFSMQGEGFGGQCFPGGHSSGGFAWIALYYFAAQYFPSRRKVLLACVLAIGVIFGVTQELRGAHFLTHDIASLALAWLVATLMYALFWRRAAVRTAPVQTLEAKAPQSSAL